MTFWRDWKTWAVRPAPDPRLAPFAEQAWRAGFEASTLYLDDFSAIPFLDNISGVAEYQHRARIRAGGWRSVHGSQPG